MKDTDIQGHELGSCVSPVNRAQGVCAVRLVSYTGTGGKINASRRQLSHGENRHQTHRRGPPRLSAQQRLHIWGSEVGSGVQEKNTRDQTPPRF